MGTVLYEHEFGSALTINSPQFRVQSQTETQSQTIY